MKILITGSTGLLGSSLLFNAPLGHKLIGTYHQNTLVPKVKCNYVYLDVTKKPVVREVIKKIKPEVIIHTAALATPDYCDKHKEEAEQVNVQGTENILAAAKALTKFKPHVIYITTNGVYDGKNAPYSESDTPHPIDWYGETKYRAECLVAESKLPYSIIRMNTMYGWNNPHERQNPVTWLLKILGENKTPVNMVDDMFNSFLYVVTASEAIWKVVESEPRGETYNIGGKDCESRYDFSKKISEAFKLSSEMIYPVKLSFFKNFVPRPQNTCFVLGKMEKMLKIKPLSSRKALLHMVKNSISDENWRRLR